MAEEAMEVSAAAAAGPEEDTSYLQLPVEERCVHKSWKARQSGFEECAKLFPRLEGDDPAWKKFSPIVKKFCSETNVIVLESGLEATLRYAANCNAAAKSAGEIMDGIVGKCMGATKPKTKDLAKQICLQLCEVEAHEKVIEDLIKGLTQKNPKVVCGCLATMTEILRVFGAKVIKISPLLKVAIPVLDNRDKAIRNEGKLLIKESYRWVGELLKQQLSGVKPVQLSELEEEFQKVATEAGKAKPERYLKSQQALIQQNGDGAGVDGTDVGGTDEGKDGGNKADETDTFDLLDPVDILPKLPKNFFELVEDKKWVQRKEALDALLPLCQTAKIESSNDGIGDLVRALRKVVAKDANVTLVAQAALCLTGLAKGLRASFKSHAFQCLPVLLEKYKEKKVNVVSALSEALDAMYSCMGIETMQEESLAALKHKTPSVVSETAKFLARCFSRCPQQLATNKKVTKGYVCALLEKLSHPDMSVRDAAAEALGVLLKFLGESNLGKLLIDVDSTKMAKIKEFEGKAVLTGKKASAAAVAPVKAKVVKADSKTTKAGVAGTAKVGKLKLTPGPAKQPSSSSVQSTSSSKKKGEDADTSPPYVTSNLKNARFKDELKLKILKWNFTTPRPEFVDQLREQMATSNFNKTLLSQLFHQDFKQHLKAVETLSTYLSSDLVALASNLDLVLKWTTLRFFETNPSVLMKCLEYLQEVFRVLADDSYQMQDLEASSFIPYLIIKVGDPKDPVRNSVKSILKTLIKIYPASKVAIHLMYGLNSKNAKQRAECLDELGSLVTSFGTSVLQQPTVGTCLKEIAKQIADRDNSVRNAALNCMTAVYFQDGEKMYKAVGNIPEKDRAMLEERIKRQFKTLPVPLPDEQQKQPKQAHPPSSVASGGSSTGGGSKSSSTQVNGSSNNLPPAAPQSRSNPPDPVKACAVPAVFSLDFEKIEAVDDSEDIDVIVGRCWSKLVPHNLDDILNDEPVTLPAREPRQHQQMPTQQQVQTKQQVLDHMPEAYEALDLVLAQIFNQDVSTCLKSLAQLDELMKHHEKVRLLSQRMDQFFAACSMQYRHVLTTRMAADNADPKDVMRLFQYLTMTLLSAFRHEELTRKTSTSSLHDLVHVIASILLEPAVQSLPEAGQLIRGLNVLAVKILEKSDHTNVISAFLKLLKESIGNTSLSPKYGELIMKCLWKVIRLLPTWISDEHHLSLSVILSDLHDFLKAFPSSYWRKQETDTPIRTIKTVLHTLAKAKGEEIMDHLTRISDPETSELVHYLRKLLDSGIGKENNNELPPPAKRSATSTHNALSSVASSSSSSSSLPSVRYAKPDDQDTLAEIFKKVGQKEVSKQALLELYNFKQQNPHADLEPFLAKSAPYFRDYVEQGLKRIEQERYLGSAQVNHMESNGFQQPALLAMERLKKLREQGGLNKLEGPAYNISAAPTAPASIGASAMTSNGTPEENKDANTVQQQMPASDYEDIKERLARLKSSADFEDTKERLAKLKHSAF